MGSDELKEEDFGADRVAETRNKVAQMMDAEGVPASIVSREADVGRSTFDAWIRGVYNGNNAAVAVKMQRWLTSRLARARTRTTHRRGPGYVATPAGRTFERAMEHAQFAPDFVVIAGAPGVGKTTTARQYANQHPNVWMLTGEPSNGSPRALLEDLGEVVGVMALGTSGHRVSKSIVRKIEKSGGLIIVDEAQHLSSPALDQLRTIHDRSEIGVALLGNPAIFGRLEGGARRSEFAQLYSRVGMRTVRHAATRGDADALLDAWGVEDVQARKLCQAVARGGGALRSMTKVLRQAHLRAGDGVALNDTHVLAAAQQLGAAPRDDAAETDPGKEASR